MRKTLYLTFIIGLIMSCNNSSIKKELDTLKRENDSLKNILEEINNKYVFDSIAFRDIYSNKNTNKLNSDFEIELLVVGYNHKESFFTKYDSINSKGELINAIPLKQSNGGFKYRTKLKRKLNPINIQMNINSKFGKTKSGMLHDKINVTD